MSRILNKTITLYNHAGEADYKAKYEVTIIERVYTTDKSGVYVKGDAPDDAFVAYIFDRKSTARSLNGAVKTYLPSGEWNELSDKSGYWTLHDDGNDIVVPGTQTDVQKPIELFGARKIVQYYRLKAGTPRMWHRKVVAK